MPSSDDATTTQQEGIRMQAIADVERDTGLARATLRIWERRYGFPAPARDARGERAYPADQVEVLRLMRELMERGWRPAALVAKGPQGIRQLAAEARAQEPPAAHSKAAARLVRLLQSHDVAALRRELAQRLQREGLARFASSGLAECSRVVGEAWSSGALQVHEEHLYSDCVDGLLREAIAALEPRQRAEAPRALLTTFPSEAHGLGLRMAQVQLALQGCPTVSLGVRTPVDQVAAAARAHRADLVGLSFSPSHPPQQALRGLEELRGLLPPTVRIWAGGSRATLRRGMPGVRVVTDVAHVRALLAEDFALPPLEEEPGAAS
jgi:DNA-binding transcriptional MerR regulator/methylmalonyl-CoA mutase cobalamin-binding subunit